MKEVIDKIYEYKFFYESRIKSIKKKKGYLDHEYGRRYELLDKEYLEIAEGFVRKLDDLIEIIIKR